MYLITELENETTCVIEEGANGKKDLFIEGIFMQAEKLNRNGRVYPGAILEREAVKYIKEQVDTKRALGELNHPSSPSINPDRASHLITSLVKEGTDYIGKAKILNTPTGNIVRGLLEGGVSIGVSTRGLGSIKEIEGVPTVQEDFQLRCVDIVANPSAPDAYVQGIFEGAEWVYGADGQLEQIVEREKKLLEQKSDNAQKIKSFISILKQIG